MRSSSTTVTEGLGRWHLAHLLSADEVECASSTGCFLLAEHHFFGVWRLSKAGQRWRRSQNGTKNGILERLESALHRAGSRYRSHRPDRGESPAQFGRRAVCHDRSRALVASTPLIPAFNHSKVTPSAPAGDVPKRSGPGRKAACCLIEPSGQSLRSGSIRQRRPSFP